MRVNKQLINSEIIIIIPNTTIAHNTFCGIFLLFLCVVGKEEITYIVIKFFRVYLLYRHFRILVRVISLNKVFSFNSSETVAEN